MDFIIKKVKECRVTDRDGKVIALIQPITNENVMQISDNTTTLNIKNLEEERND